MSRFFAYYVDASLPPVEVFSENPFVSTRRNDLYWGQRDNLPYVATRSNESVIGIRRNDVFISTRTNEVYISEGVS